MGTMEYVVSMRWGLACLSWVAMASCFVACATGTVDEDINDATESTSTSSGATSGSGGMGTGGESATSSSSSSSSSSTTTGGGGMGPMCNPPEHLCGGICVGNTVQTGCTNSVDCSPCVAPTANGSVSCSGSGDCTTTCDQGYTQVGTECTCATECCSENDCSGSEICDQNGQCTNNCSITNPPGFLACQAICALLSMSCPGNGSCTCI